MRRTTIERQSKKVPKGGSGRFFWGAKIESGEFDLFFIQNTKPPVQSRRFGELGTISTPTTPSGIDRFVVAVIGRDGRLRQILARTRAGIDETGIPQSPPTLEVKEPPFALRIRPLRAATIRPFTPPDAEPLQIRDHGTDKLRTRALRIEVFVAKDERACVFDRALRSDPKRARMAKMEKACRRGREASAIRVWG